MQAAYLRLHHAGFAQSIEVWQGHDLVGGLYGVTVGELFCGESMFHLQRDASKVALLALCQHMLSINWPIIDCQIPNPHLESLGACNIARKTFKQYLPQLDIAWQDNLQLLKPANAFSEHSWQYASASDLL